MKTKNQGSNPKERIQLHLSCIKNHIAGILREIQPTNMKESLKITVAALALLSLLAGGVWLDNHLPGFDPIETRLHP